jgi:hypothetical protein
VKNEVGAGEGVNGPVPFPEVPRLQEGFHVSQEPVVGISSRSSPVSRR